MAFCNTPELAAEVTLQPVRRFGVDAAIVFSDILVVPHALGQTVRFVEGEGPVLDPLVSERDVERLECDQVIDANAALFETLVTVSRELDCKTALIGFAGAPLTLSAYMIDGKGGLFSKTREMVRKQPFLLDSLVARLTEVVSEFLVAQVDAGVECIQLFDSWAGLLDNPEDLKRWSLEPVRQIAAEVRRKRPGVPFVAFPRGVGTQYEAFARSAGVTALQVDQGVSLSCMRRLQDTCPVQGNLDPDLVRRGGTRMTDEATRIVNFMRNGCHVFNLGHGIHKETDPEDVLKLVNCIRSAEAENA